MQTHNHVSAYDCEAASTACRQALDLYRGLFLTDINIETELFEQWREALQDRYRRQVLYALYVLAEHEERAGSWTAAETYARRQLEIERWNEEAHRQLMRILLASGRRSAALVQYEACRQALADELGAVPAEETDALYARIVAGVAPPAPVQLYNPYKGLAPFAIEDMFYFFGREAMTDRLLAAVGEQPLVALLGASGSGKSSVLHAGWLPGLHCRRVGSTRAQSSHGTWCIASLRPGATPLSALADTLVNAGCRPPRYSSLLELLRHGEISLADMAAAVPALAVPGKEEARARKSCSLLSTNLRKSSRSVTTCKLAARFCASCSARQPARVENSRAPPSCSRMRADFLGQALQHRELADALQEHTLLLGPMTRAELQRAIEEPARLQGAVLEPGLVDRILDDVGSEPGRLPLLQFALALLWLHQQDGWLTHSTYDAIGGLRGALTDYADEVFLHLSLAEQQAARQIFLTLVEPGFDVLDIRHLATRAEIGDTFWPVAQRLADARLVVTNTNAEGNETVELAHEALIREWQRLREWLDANREFRRWQQQLRIAAEHWRQNSADESTLLFGGRLAEAERWAERAAHRHRPLAAPVYRRQPSTARTKTQ